MTGGTPEHVSRLRHALTDFNRARARFRKLVGSVGRRAALSRFRRIHEIVVATDKIRQVGQELVESTDWLEEYAYPGAVDGIWTRRTLEGLDPQDMERLVERASEYL